MLPPNRLIEHPELAKLLARRLLQRRDVKAVQSPSGAYRPIKKRWTNSDLSNHIAGRVTYGHYLLDGNGMTRICALDLDYDEEVCIEGVTLNPREVFADPHHPYKPYLNRRIRALADGLAYRLGRHHPNLTILTSFSGSKGLHIIGCFETPTTGQAARTVATSVLTSYGSTFVAERGKNFWVHRCEFEGIKIETFPKQRSVGTGRFGNLMRMPLGINQKTQAPGFFYNPNAPLEHLEVDDPMSALTKGSLR